MFFPKNKTVLSTNEGAAFIVLAWEELFSHETPDSYQPKLLNIPALVEELGQISARAKRVKKWERHVKKIQEELKAACEIEQNTLARVPKLLWQLQCLAISVNHSEIQSLIKIIKHALLEYESLAANDFADA